VAGDKHLDRITAFTDAIFAIALTLLVLDVKLPPLPPGTSDRALGEALLTVVPKFGSYVLSFVTVAVYWSASHRRFRVLAGYDGRFIVLNLVSLFFISFVPFPRRTLMMPIACGLSIMMALASPPAALVFLILCIPAQVLIGRMPQRYAHEGELDARAG